jgi:aldehyde dehydrogenase (NAD+)
MKTITKHYIDGAFVESHGREVMDIIRPTDRQVIGRVVINGMTDDPQAPWGGFKHSGVGREYGRYGIEAFLEPRAILES